MRKYIKYGALRETRFAAKEVTERHKFYHVPNFIIRREKNITLTSVISRPISPPN